MMRTLPKPLLECRQLQGLAALTDDALFEACGVRLAFTGRDGGVSAFPYDSLNTADHVGDDLACVQRNRATVLKALGFAQVPLIVPNQVHGTDIVTVRSESDVPRAAEEAAAGADAVMVEAAGVGALLNFADCLPLIIVSPSGRFAVVHAGWRGAVAGIAGKAARLLAAADAREGVGTSSYNAYIGPHIRRECFETAPDVAARFADRFGDGVLHGERHVSLAEAVSVDLAEAGLARERIADAGVCTVCHPERYFSYRASGGTCGRHAAVAIRM